MKRTTLITVTRHIRLQQSSQRRRNKNTHTHTLIEKKEEEAEAASKKKENNALKLCRFLSINVYIYCAHNFLVHIYYVTVKWKNDNGYC